MVKVIYVGDKKTCNVKAGSVRIKGWKKGEIKDICPIAARRMVANIEFKLADEKDIIKNIKVKEEVVKEDKYDKFDFNKDGVVDERDMSLAGQALASRRKKRSKDKEE